MPRNTEEPLTRSGKRPAGADDPRRRHVRAFRQLLGQILVIGALLTILAFVGTAGLRLTTGAPWFDCLYMAVITLSTVGFGETIPLGTQGRSFIMVFLALSVGVFTFSVFTLGSLLMSPQLQDFWRMRRMHKKIDGLSKHYIICGLGRMGVIIGEYLHQRGQPFLVIDSDEQRIASICEPRGWLHLNGDATDDQTLIDAGITRAQSLAAVLPTDSDNVYVVLSARMLTQGLQIIARAGSPKSVEKLQHAGASRVVSPYSSGAVKMARFMLSPTVEDFLEIADESGLRLELADIEILASSPYAGQQLSETDFRRRGVMVVGIRRSTGETLMLPASECTIAAGDRLFAFGTTQAVNDVIDESLVRR